MERTSTSERIPEYEAMSPLLHTIGGGETKFALEDVLAL